MGWLVECIFCTIDDKKLVYDRGFLLGPYCPIYGWGALYMYFFLGKYQNDPLVLFIMAMVGTSILEYITSFFMEKLFRARWWDYSNRKFNIEGRVCLLNSILFGILGLAFTYLIHPAYLGFIHKIPESVLIILSILLFVVYLVDNILSFTIIEKLKLRVDTMKKDSTSEIDQQVREFLSHYKFYIKRLLKAFPQAQILSTRGNPITSMIQSSLERIEHESKKYREKLEKAAEKRKRKIEKMKRKIANVKSQRKKEKLRNRLNRIKSKN